MEAITNRTSYMRQYRLKHRPALLTYLRTWQDDMRSLRLAVRAAGAVDYHK